MPLFASEVSQAWAQLQPVSPNPRPQLNRTGLAALSQDGDVPAYRRGVEMLPCKATDLTRPGARGM